MAVRTARGLEAGVGSDKALAYIPATRLAEGFIRSPTASGKALRGANELESVLRRSQMHGAAIDQISLNCGTKRIEMAVGMKAGKDVISFGEGDKVVLILEESLRQLTIAQIAAAQVGEIKVFWKGVSFVPTVGDVLMGQRASLNARLRTGRQVRQHGVGRVAEHRQSHRVAGKRVGIQ